MSGIITKKHFFLVLKTFGIRKALKLLVSRQLVALNTLMV